MRDWRAIRCAEHGLRVPQDVSVVGYDDRDFAVLSRPRLTTIHQPLKKMAAAATRMVDLKVDVVESMGSGSISTG